jgi:hypothetical protein
MRVLLLPGFLPIGLPDSKMLQYPSSWKSGNRIGGLQRRLAIRAAKFGPEADFVSRAVGEKPTTKESQWQRKNEGPLRGQ